MVLHLVTALSGPLGELEQRILDAAPSIERWFRLEWMEHTPPVYSTAALCNSGFKVAALDTDLFPQDWQRLPSAMVPLAVQAMLSVIEKTCPEARNLLIIPELHRCNQADYVRSLGSLRHILQLAGLHVRFGGVEAQHTRALELHAPALGDAQPAVSLTVEPLRWHRQRVGLEGFDPCILLLNNDLHDGIPGIVEELPGQFVLPAVQASWSVRRRSRHFGHHEELSKRLAKLLGIDPWLITALHANVPASDALPHRVQHLQALADAADQLLARIRRKYREYGITHAPSLTLWPDGARVEGSPLCLHDASQVPALLSASPHIAQHTGWLLQEGLQSCERLNEQCVQPLVYMIDRHVIGGFYRGHDCVAGRDSCAHGADHGHDSFTPLPLATPTRNAASAPNRFYIYGVLARLAALAASYEIEATADY